MNKFTNSYSFIGIREVLNPQRDWCNYINNYLTLVFILVNITCISYLGKKAEFPLWATLLPIFKSAFFVFALLSELSQDINREVFFFIKMCYFGMYVLTLITKTSHPQKKPMSHSMWFQNPGLPSFLAIDQKKRPF